MFLAQLLAERFAKFKTMTLLGQSELFRLTNQGGDPDNRTEKRRAGQRVSLPLDCG